MLVLTQKEFEKKSKMNLQERLVDYIVDAEISLAIEKFLEDVSFYTFEYAIYPQGKKWFIDEIIESEEYTVKEQIKNILIKVAEYMLINIDENVANFSGLIATEQGSVEIKDSQEIISKLLPPNIMTAVMNITPNIVYAGGMPNV